MNKTHMFRAFLISFAIFLISHYTSASAVMDFDGDGKTDPTVVRSENGKWVWYSLCSRDGYFAIQWGQNISGMEDRFVPADYDGDGKWDIAVWRRHIREEGQSYFFIYYSQTSTFDVIPWGLKDDQPVPQDYDGDGKADIAVYRSLESTYYIQQSRDGFRAERWGPGTPINGDYDGDGKADLAVYRRDVQTPTADLTFYINRSSDGQWIVERFGYLQADIPVSGDFDGDGKSDIAVWRGRSEYGNGVWYWHRSSDGAFDQIKWGLTFPPDYPVQGDYDGDGKTDVAVYRKGIAPQSYFFINESIHGFTAIPWGAQTDSSISQF